MTRVQRSAQAHMPSTAAWMLWCTDSTSQRIDYLVSFHHSVKTVPENKSNTLIWFYTLILFNVFIWQVQNDLDLFNLKKNHQYTKREWIQGNNIFHNFLSFAIYQLTCAVHQCCTKGVKTRCLETRWKRKRVDGGWSSAHYGTTHSRKWEISLGAHCSWQQLQLPAVWGRWWCWRWWVERTVESKVWLGMGWRCPEGLSYDLVFLYTCHLFDNASHMGVGGMGRYQGEALGVGKRWDFVRSRHHILIAFWMHQHFLAVCPCSSRLFVPWLVTNTCTTGIWLGTIKAFTLCDRNCEYTPGLRRIKTCNNGEKTRIE